MTNRKYRVGLVGTGPPTRTVERGGGFAIGRVHANAWTAIEQAELVAACDINPDNLDAFCHDYGVDQGFLSYQDMLQRADLDVVSICTWPGLHCEMAVAAAEAGVRGIYCEKPMCLSLEEADRMIAACRVNGARLSVSHQRRFERLYVQAKSWIDSGRLGKITEMYGRISKSDADLLSWGTHWFDLFGFFQNDIRPISVLAQADCSMALTRYGHPVENHSVVQLTYDGGVTCLLEGGDDLPAPCFRIHGEQGCLTLAGTLSGWLNEGKGAVRVDIEPGASDFTDSYVPAMRDLIEAVEQDRPSALDGARARTAMEIIMAAYESANTGRRVTLPMTRKTFPLLERSEFTGAG